MFTDDAGNVVDGKTSLCLPDYFEEWGEVVGELQALGEVQLVVPVLEGTWKKIIRLFEVQSIKDVKFKYF